MSTRLSTESGFHVESRTRLFNVQPQHYGDGRTTYGVTADDQRFVFVTTDYPGRELGSAEVFVVPNFFEELKVGS